MKSKIDLQAGGIVVRRVDGAPHVLVVTAYKSRDRWVLPKGRVSKKEKPKDAALREVREEAGVGAKVLGLAGVAEYRNKKGITRVEYYLMEYTRPVKGGDERRDARWCPVEDAIQLLSFASARRVLLEAHEPIVALCARGASRSKTARSA